MIHVLLVITVRPALQIPLLALFVHKIQVRVLFVVLAVVIIVDEQLDFIWGWARVVILVRVVVGFVGVDRQRLKVGVRLMVIGSVLLLDVI